MVKNKRLDSIKNHGKIVKKKEKNMQNMFNPPPHPHTTTQHMLINVIWTEHDRRTAEIL